MEECQVADLPDGTGNALYIVHVLHTCEQYYKHASQAQRIYYDIALMSTRDEEQ